MCYGFIFYSIIIGLYVILILLFIIGFDKLKPSTKNHDGTTQFSVIIPFRNEGENLPDLLNSIAVIEYNKSLYEIILVDDESTDNSLEIINQFCANNPTIDIKTIKNSRQSNSPKKDAISTAISNTKYSWIVATDADCLLPKTWFSSFNSSVCENNPNMIVAPVSFKSNSSFLHQFQLIDFLSMQGATIGGFGIQQPFMANGANLAYKKEVFLQLNGFKDNDFIASGDDVFLLENFVAHNKFKVLFLKDIRALVTTYPAENWNELIQQRKRWAAKATHFKSNFAKAIGIIVLFANLGVGLLLIISLYHPIFLTFLLLKFVIDSLVIFKTAHLYQNKINLLSFLKTLLFYPYFTVYIAITSLLSPFVWKDRRFNK
mgnify:FL=1